MKESIKKIIRLKNKINLVKKQKETLRYNRLSYTKIMQSHKGDKIRDLDFESVHDQDYFETQNHSIIVNCYQSKKVSLLNEQTLICEKSFYINFNVQQIPNHKIYIMYVTSYRIYLMCTVDSEIVSIPHAYIKDYTFFDNEIRFTAKTGLKYFLLPVESLQTQQIYDSLLSGQKSIPFSLFVKFNDQQPQVYDCLAEMERMLISWKKVSAIDNKNGKEISTYPKIIFVPAKIDKEVVKQNQRSRFNSRIPALTYYCHSQDVALWRCGHPVREQNNKYDYSYLEAISANLLIIQIQEMQNRRQSVYSFNHFSNKIKYSIYRFENLFQVKCHYEKLISSYLKDDMGIFWKALNKWYEEIDVLIRCAWKAAEHMKNKRHVLVQQNDFSKTETTITSFPKGGVDRACEICALIQVIIDPYYRSMKGLSVLIEKEFMSFGYPFKDRTGFNSENQSPDSPKKLFEQSALSLMSSMYREPKQQKNQISPTFIQFLECLSQLINCFPSHFQYSSEYLAQIAYELYSAKYNNFLFNTINEKHSNPDLKNTQSLYQHIGVRKGFWNLQFLPQKTEPDLLNLRGPPHIKEYLIWKEYWEIVTKMNCAERKSQNPLQTAVFRKHIKERSLKNPLKKS